MRSRTVRAQARLTAVAEILEAPVFPEDAEGPIDCATGLIATAGKTDDGYCSLCRRCQMRRKLEKRLQRKKDEEDEVCISDDVADKRTIEEIMEFIGGDNPKSRRRRRRRRRKRGQHEMESGHVHESASPQSLNSGSGSGSSLGEHDAISNAYQYKHALQGGVESLGSDDGISGRATSSRSDATDEDASENQHGCHSESGSMGNRLAIDGKTEFDGITPEQEAEIQREVEEFRMRIALRPPARDRPRLALPNL